MTANLSAVTAAAQTYGDERAADQKAVDDARLNSLQGDYDALKRDYVSLTAEYNAYRQSHPDTPVTPPDPKPPTATTLMGSAVNGPLFTTLGYTKVPATRVFLRQLPAGSTWTNIIGDGGATGDLKDGIARATDLIWLSCKETDPKLVDAFLAKKPAGLPEVWWTHHHEPENDAGYTPAQFVAEQKKMSPIARKYGCRFATVLMRYTFSKASGRDWQAYFPADLASFVDIFGCDSYNTGNKKQTYSVPSDQIKPIKDAADARGLPWAIGETGASIFGAPAVRAKWAADLAAEAKAQKGLAVAWWDQDSYAFDQATATVWLGKP
jgi:hypothetical protein